MSWKLFFMISGVILIILAYVGIPLFLIKVLKMKEEISTEISTVLTIILIVSFFIVYG